MTSIRTQTGPQSDTFSYLKKESFLIDENLEAQEAPESNNAVMLFNSSVSPATWRRFFFEIVSLLLVCISAVINVSFELEIFAHLSSIFRSERQRHKARY